MQIRIGNKQDEPGCRELVKCAAETAGVAFDLQGKDKDLKNIEASYIGRDGIFLVAEDGPDVIAFAGAARGDTDEICLLRRLVVAPSAMRSGLGRKLVEHIFFFARNLDYKIVRFSLDRAEFAAYSQLATFLKSSGFAAVDVSPDMVNSDFVLEKPL